MEFKYTKRSNIQEQHTTDLTWMLLKTDHFLFLSLISIESVTHLLICQNLIKPVLLRSNRQFMKIKINFFSAACLSLSLRGVT